MAAIFLLMAMAVCAVGLGCLLAEGVLRRQRLTPAILPAAAAAGMGIIICLMLLMGAAGILKSLPIRIAALLILALSLRGWRYPLSLLPPARLIPARLKKIGWPAAMAALLLMLLAFSNLAGALSPSIYWDDLSYHLPLSRDYLAAGRLVSHNYMPHSYMPEGSELLFAAGTALAGKAMPALIHFFFGILIVGLMLALAWEMGSIKAGLIGAIIFYSMPVLTWLSMIAYVDLAAAALGLAALLTGMKGLGKEADSRWLLFAGILAGFAFSVKYSAIIFPALLLMWLLIRAATVRDISFRQAGAFLLPQIILAGPWLLRSWRLAGTPLWPYLAGIVDDPGMADMARAFAASFSGFAEVSRTPLELLILPFRITYESHLFDASAGPMLLAALPAYFALRGARRPFLDRALLLAGGFTVIWFFTGPQLRFLLPALAIFSLAAGFAIAHLLEYAQARRIVILILAAGVASSIFYTGSFGRERAQLQRYNKVIMGLGLVDSSLCLQGLNLYEAAEFLNANAGSGERVLAFNENRGFFFDNEFIWADEWLRVQQLKELPEAAWLKRKGIRWLLVAGRPAAHEERLLDMLQKNQITMVRTNRPLEGMVIFYLP